MKSKHEARNFLNRRPIEQLLGLLALFTLSQQGTHPSSPIMRVFADYYENTEKFQGLRLQRRDDGNIRIFRGTSNTAQA